MIKLANFSCKYPGSDSYLLSNASIQLNPGKIYGLEGSNGSGKSTLLHLINDPSFLPLEGSFKVDFEESSIQLILQNPWLPPLLSLNELLTLLINLNQNQHRHSLDHFKQSLKKEEYKKYDRLKPLRFGKYSTGERQWVALNLGFYFADELLLLDEPTNGLDTISRKQFWEKIKHQNSLGKTIIITSHLQNELRANTDATIKIRNKKLFLHSNQIKHYTFSSKK